MDMWVVATFALVGLLEIIFPILVGYWLIRRYHIFSMIFLFGALTFVLIQIFSAPFMAWVQASLLHYLGAPSVGLTASFAVSAIVLGLVTGLTLESARYLILRFVFPRTGYDLSRKNAVLFGAGWGGIESIGIGIILIFAMAAYILTTPITSDQIDQINRTVEGSLTDEEIEILIADNEALLGTHPLDLLPSLLERLVLFILQIAFTLLVLTAVIGGRPLFLVLAILWHAATDTLFFFLGPNDGIVYLQLALLVSALGGIWYIRRVWNDHKYEQIPAGPTR
jgi:uncharacterized membrane protein YhfC